MEYRTNGINYIFTFNQKVLSSPLKITLFLFKEMAVSVNDSNFKETVLDAGVPAVVDFWATWCGPCRMLSPIIDSLAQKFEGKVLVAKCNVDDSTDIPMQYGIRNIPTILFFKDGQLVGRSVGAVPQSELENKINSLIG